MAPRLNVPTTIGESRGQGLSPPWRVPMLAVALLTMVLGALAGLVRSGQPMPVVQATHVANHAALMFGGFFGTVISLERAVALGARWGYLAPLLAAAGAVALWLGGPPTAAALLHLAAGAVLVAASWRLHARQPQMHSRLLVVASACWPLGVLAWLATGHVVPAIALWSDFLVLTIAGERLELSRLMPAAPNARRLFAAIVVCCLAAALAAPFVAGGARVPLGAGYAALAVWLFRHDIARRTARAAGLTGFIGRALMSGYVWLVAGGAMLIAAGLGDEPLWRDAALHAVLLGFVMSMVLGHAPIIFPAVVRVRIPYHPAFYVPLVLLHGSLLLRVAGGLAGAPELRTVGAIGNAIALAAFVVVIAGSVIRGARARRSSASSRR